MKLNHETQEILTNSQHESKFTINASAQAFKILSDGLYEHKVAAIVRELTCNAYDAHVEKGNEDEPFKVILPNNLHPYFEIEDYGIGLDDDGVRDVYTSYFTSTKTNSNDVIGAFGLGSKTPFSYTTSFTIRARKDGVERLYNAYIGSDGAPCVNMMYEKDTEECSGVKITVPVKEHNFRDFRNEASFILSFFKTPPIVNDPTFEVAVPGIVDELEEQALVSRKFKSTGSSLYTGRVYAVMGGVCYKLDEYWIRSGVASDYLSEIVLSSTWREAHPTLFVKFEIGELEVAASRETLSLDEKTKDFVIQRIKDSVDDLKRKDEETIDAQGHQIKALEHIIDRYNLGPIGFSIFDYKGKSLRDISIRRLFKKSNLEFQQFKDTRTYSYNKKRVSRYNHVDAEDIASSNEINCLYYEEGQKRTSLVKFGRNITPTKGNGIALVFFDPLTEHKRKRIEQYLGREVQWHNLQDMKDEEKLLKPQTPSSQGHARDPNYKPPSETTVRSKSIEIRPQKDSYNDHSAERIDLTNEDTVFFRATINNTRFDNVGITYKNKTISARALTAILMDLGHEHVTVVGENSQNKKKLARNGIPSIDSVLDQYIEDYKDDLELAWIHHQLESRSYSNSLLIRELLDSTNSNISKVYRDALEQNKLDKPCKGAYLLMERIYYHTCDLFVDQEQLTPRVEKCEEINKKYEDMFLENYPMLVYMIVGKRRIESDDMDRASEYVKLVDLQNKVS